MLALQPANQHNDTWKANRLRVSTKPVPTAASQSAASHSQAQHCANHRNLPLLARAKHASLGGAQVKSSASQAAQLYQELQLQKKHLEGTEKLEKPVLAGGSKGTPTLKAVPHEQPSVISGMDSKGPKEKPNMDSWVPPCHPWTQWCHSATRAFRGGTLLPPVPYKGNNNPPAFQAHLAAAATAFTELLLPMMPKEYKESCFPRRSMLFCRGVFGALRNGKHAAG